MNPSNSKCRMMTCQPAPDLNSRRIFLLLVVYFILHLLIRLCVSNSAELDEAEQLLLAQDLRLGYGSQPPLYTWLQTGLFSLFGIHIFALAVLKNCLLFLTCLFVYLGAREVTHDNNRAVIAMLSLLWIPQICWESQRDLTHSVLGTTVAAGTLWVMLRLLKTGRLHDYVMLGLCAGIGILAKYNYAVFLVALLVAACSLKNFRPRVCNRKMGLAVVCLLLVTSPHLYWAITHMPATLTQVDKFHVGRSAGLFASYWLGLQSLLGAVVCFLGLLLPVYALFFYKRGSPDLPAAGNKDAAALVLRLLLTGLGLCILMILFFKVSVFKDRWMQPLLFATPLYLVTLPWARWNPMNVRGFAVFSVVGALAVLVGIPAHTLGASTWGDPGRLNAPYAALAAQLRQAGFKGGQIIAQDRLVGGNLKLFFPDSVVEAPEVPSFAASINADRLIVWNATRKDEMPDKLRDFAATRSCPDPSHLQPQYVQAPYQYAADRSMRLGFVRIGRDAP